jgi:hypothetical protein
MRVYKFYPAHWAHEALIKRRIKVSPIDELNDPFEYLSLDVSERRVRAWATNFRKIASDGSGIISFSRNWKQPLLWAHYADSHRGIALGFDVPDHLMLAMVYIENRIRPPFDVDQFPDKRKDLVERMLRSKHAEWQYEDEVRLHRKLENCIVECGNYFAPFNRVTVLKEVILGARYESANLNCLQNDLSTKEGVRFLTARAEFGGFHMTKQRLAGMQKNL